MKSFPFFCTNLGAREGEIEGSRICHSWNPGPKVWEFLLCLSPNRQCVKQVSLIPLDCSYSVSGNIPIITWNKSLHLLAPGWRNILLSKSSLVLFLFNTKTKAMTLFGVYLFFSFLFFFCCCLVFRIQCLCQSFPLYLWSNDFFGGISRNYMLPHISFFGGVFRSSLPGWFWSKFLMKLQLELPSPEVLLPIGLPLRDRRPQ